MHIRNPQTKSEPSVTLIAYSPFKLFVCNANKFYSPTLFFFEWQIKNSDTITFSSDNCIEIF